MKFLVAEVKISSLRPMFSAITNMKFTSETGIVRGISNGLPSPLMLYNTNLNGISFSVMISPSSSVIVSVKVS